MKRKILLLSMVLSLFFIACDEDDKDSQVVVSSGTVSGGPFNIIVGDSISDKLNSIAVIDAVGFNSLWIVTDDNKIITNLFKSVTEIRNFNFESSTPGESLIWFARYEGTITGNTIGENVNNLSGDIDISSTPIKLTKRAASKAGVISSLDAPFVFDVGDDIVDNVSSIEVDLTDAVGPNSTWIITDADGIILGLPATIADVEANDFDGAGDGTCKIWYARYEGDVTGLEVGSDANAVTGNFDLSNSIDVVRNLVFIGPTITPATITGGPFTFNLGDGIDDIINGGTQPVVSAGDAASIDPVEPVNNDWIVINSDNVVVYAGFGNPNAGGVPAESDPVINSWGINNNNWETADIMTMPAGTYKIHRVTYARSVFLFPDIRGVDLDIYFDDPTKEPFIALSSNSIDLIITRPRIGPVITPPTITGGPFEFNLGDGISDVINGGTAPALAAGDSSIVDPDEPNNNDWIVLNSDNVVVYAGFGNPDGGGGPATDPVINSWGINNNEWDTADADVMPAGTYKMHRITYVRSVFLFPAIRGADLDTYFDDPTRTNFLALSNPVDFIVTRN